MYGIAVWHEGERWGWVSRDEGGRVRGRKRALTVATRPAAEVIADACGRSWGEWGRENGYVFRAESM